MEHKPGTTAASPPPKLKPFPKDPKVRLVTVGQIEERNPGLRGRMREWIKKADRDDAEYSWIRLALFRVGRNVLIDEIAFSTMLYERCGIPPSPARNRIVEGEGGSGTS